jgi:hypothetical protein
MFARKPKMLIAVVLAGARIRCADGPGSYGREAPKPFTRVEQALALGFCYSPDVSVDVSKKSVDPT